jgi:hypothetical protein
MSPLLKRPKKKSEKAPIEELPHPPPPTNGFFSPSRANPDFIPPSTLPEEILIRPPIAEEPSQREDDNTFLTYVEDDITTDILQELEESRFGSFLKTVPPKEPVVIKPEALAIQQFKDAKDAYLTAASKHLELKFFENASSLYSCAIICVFLSEGVFHAAHLMKELGGKLPAGIVKSYMFQGVKMLLKAYLLKHPTYLRQAKEWLFRNPEHLYREDQELIHRAIRVTENIVELL